MKKRATFNLELDVIERMRDIVAFLQSKGEQITLVGEVEDALNKKLAHLEKRVGGQVPRRRQSLRIGRPPR